MNGPVRGGGEAVEVDQKVGKQNASKLPLYLS